MLRIICHQNCHFKVSHRFTLYCCTQIVTAKTKTLLFKKVILKCYVVAPCYYVDVSAL
uniref:Uncharacterized protein n=1 Tax=Anguilla anguilla TaxID=7936 RepID=A0A0E9VP26_ANGAN